MMKVHAPSRRELLSASGTLFAWAHLPKLAYAEGRDPRFLTIILRGALDGLATVAPVGDPDWLTLRGDNALNRALAGLAPGGRVDPRGSKLFAVGPVTPLVVRGPAPVFSWAPQRLMPASDDTVHRLLDLYRHADSKLASALEDNANLSAVELANTMAQKPGIANPRQVRAYFSEAAGTAAKFLAQPDGPRVGALALDGWDTHFNEGIAQGRLSQLLAALDAALAAIKSNMGTGWRETVVALATEFGRTARINGTAGTDHSTATVALLVGGALKGDRVIADWPGLKAADLYQARDLKPTTDLRAVLKGVLRDHLRADERALTQGVFPGSDGVKPMGGFWRSLDIQHPSVGIQNRLLHHLRQGRMRENGVNELFFRGLEIHRHHVALNQFGDLGADHVGAKELAGLLVEDHFDEALILAHRDRFAVAHERESSDADIDILFLGGLLGEADRSDLR